MTFKTINDTVFKNIILLMKILINVTMAKMNCASSTDCSAIHYLSTRFLIIYLVGNIYS